MTPSSMTQCKGEQDSYDSDLPPGSITVSRKSQQRKKHMQGESNSVPTHVQDGFHGTGDTYHILLFASYNICIVKILHRIQ